MGDWNLGSVVDNVPLNLSGTQLIGIADRKRIFVANELGITIDSDAIGENYQLPILNFTIADAVHFKNTNDIDDTKFKLDVYSSEKSASSKKAALMSADKYEQEAWDSLGKLKGEYNYYKALG